MNRICTINDKILRQTNDALLRINQITDGLSNVRLSPRTGNVNTTTNNDLSMCEMMNLDPDGTLTPTARRNKEEAKILKDSIFQI